MIGVPVLLVTLLDEIRDAVNHLRTPVAFADQLFVLREHISGVRNRPGGEAEQHQR